MSGAETMRRGRSDEGCKSDVRGRSDEGCRSGERGRSDERGMSDDGAGAMRGAERASLPPYRPPATSPELRAQR